jgi:hypothetical protein
MECSPQSLSAKKDTIMISIHVHSLTENTARFPRFIVIALAVAVGCFGQFSVAPASAADTDSKVEAPGLGNPGTLQSLSILTGRSADQPVVISGRDSAQQLIVFGNYSSGQVRDLTRQVTFQVTPEGIARIDQTGYLRPISEGKINVTVTGPENMQASCEVEITNLQHDLAINFRDKIVPIFTKHGCNGGGCHGKSGGQNGFRLSLLGFEAREDFEYLVKEGRGRRLFPAAPDRSLLLTKATGKVPHGGGARFSEDSPSYSLLRRWIEQGMPYGEETDPKVVRIQITPSHTLLPRSAEQQVQVIAHYDNGAMEDITRMTQFDSNDPEMASVSESGLVQTGTLTGSVAVMARYQAHVDVFRATIPLGIPVQNLPKENNFIDKFVFQNLTDLGLPPSDVCDDATFLRRIAIDMLGRLPSETEVAEFLADGATDKRSKLIERFLNSTDYADNFANKWGAILRNKRNNDQDKQATFAFHQWVRQSLIDNKPYDQMVRDLITANGQPEFNPPAGWYREVSDLSTQVEDTAQLFLGLRIQCAKCHHHPFEIWSQEDYYSFAAFFSQVGKKKGNVGNSSRIFAQRVVPQTNNPKTGQMVSARGLGEQSPGIKAEEDARHYLVDWMADPHNPFFAKALVNRYWKHFYGRGLVDPEDDMRVTNPASNPALLDALAQHFIDSKFDLKDLVRTICSSTTYQLSAMPNEWNVDDKQNFSRYYPKRLNAEILLDGIDQVTGTTTNFNGVPVGTRAVQLPDNGFNSYFLTVFGRPESSSACECERSGDANLAQSLHLINSSEIQNKLTAGDGMAAKLAAQTDVSNEDKIGKLYTLAYARMPAPGETEIALDYLERHKEDPKRAFEDIVWALIITKEFMFNH